MSQFPPFFLEREPDNPRNTPQYRESQDIAQNDQFGGQIAAYGSSVRSKPYIGNITLQDQIRNTKIVQNSLATADQNTPYQFLNLSPDTKNEFLDIPSFLVYPQELGLNNRYKHFVVFNIYQGTSDEVRLASRQANTESSLILAAGGVQFGIGADKTEIRRILQNSLGNQGYSDAQLTAMTDRVAQLYTGGGTGAIDGITTDARIGAFDKAITDLFVNYGNASKDDQGAIDNFLSGLSAVVGSAGDLAVNGVQGLGQFLLSLAAASNRNNLEDDLLTQRSTEQSGISGRKVYKNRKERAILLANRRFNNANIKSKDTICLYMPQKITFNDQLVYSEEEMGPIKTLTDALTGKRGAVSALIEKGLARGLADNIGRLPGVNLAGDLNIAGVRAAATRSVPNPRREMMFRDVGVRTHSFSFEFSPSNEKEAETVLNIIRMLRYHAYPGLQEGGGHFFTFPAEFELAFFTCDKGQVFMNDHLPKLPRLALQSVSVDYSGAGDFKTFRDSRPAFIKVDLQFQEMEQLTNEHIIHGY